MQLPVRGFFQHLIKMHKTIKTLNRFQLRQQSGGSFSLRNHQDERELRRRGTSRVSERRVGKQVNTVRVNREESKQQEEKIELASSHAVVPALSTSHTRRAGNPLGPFDICPRPDYVSLPHMQNCSGAFCFSFFFKSYGSVRTGQQE